MTARRTTRAHAELVERRDALLASIEDLERERAAGDLEREAFDDLHATYVARTAEVLREIEESDAVPPAPGGGQATPSVWRSFRHFLGRRRVRFVLSVVAVLCVAGSVGMVAAMLAGVRLPGQEATGGVVIPERSQIEQNLSRASALAGAGNLTQAILLYDSILRTVPNQPQALTYKGWLERLAGLARKAPGLVAIGDATLARAAEVAPGYADARGLYGIALLEDGGEKSAPAALAQFRAFLGAKNNAAVLAAHGATMAAAFSSAGEVIPAPLRPFLRSSATGAAGG
jgi:hypothetical protein